MDRKPLTINSKGAYAIALISFVGSFFFFYYYSNMPINSLVAAILSSGCFWLAYVIIRWLFLANR
jgi:hypothetical protein